MQDADPGKSEWSMAMTTGRDRDHFDGGTTKHQTKATEQ
jgi:hypothetical protein